MKVLSFAFLALVLIFATAAFATIFTYAGWNWGVVPAISGARPIGITTAFWLSLAVSTVSGMTRSSVKTKDEE